MKRNIIDVLTSTEASQIRSLTDVLTSAQKIKCNIIDVLTSREEGQERSIVDMFT